MGGRGHSPALVAALFLAGTPDAGTPSGRPPTVEGRRTMRIEIKRIENVRLTGDCFGTWNNPCG